MQTSTGLPESPARARELVITGLKLVVILGVMAFFAYHIATTYAFVMFVQESTLRDFADGTFNLTGLNSSDTTVGLLPVGLTGQWNTEGCQLPVALNDLAAATWNERIFVFGGYSGTVNSRDIYSATIQSDGSLTCWVKQSQRLPVGLNGHSVVMTGTNDVTATAYVLGGANSDDVSQNGVYEVVVSNQTGEVLSVSTNTTAWPTGSLEGVHYHSSLVNGNRVYLIGGLHLDADGFSDWVYASTYHATIGPGGKLGTFAASADLPYPMHSGSALVYHGPISDTIYIMGGTSDVGTSGNPLPLSTLLYGDINPSTGAVLNWTEAVSAAIPVPVMSHASVMVAGGELFVLGGRTGDFNTISQTVTSALADEDDSNRILNWCGTPVCDRWQTEEGSGQILAPRANAAAVYHGISIYVIGGINGTGARQKTTFRGDLTGDRIYRYAPQGSYISSRMDLGQFDVAKLKKLSWQTYMSDTSVMSMALSYKAWAATGSPPGTWTQPAPNEFYTGTDGFGTYYIYTAPLSSPITNTRYFQYRLNMQSQINTGSPRFKWIRVFFDVPDPDVQVSKFGQSPVYPSSSFSYTIQYTVTGGVPASNIVLTEIVPANTSFASGPEWKWAGGNVYTYFLGTQGYTGTLTPKTGSVSYGLVVTSTPPQNQDLITNVVRIDYPPMKDALSNVISDPVRTNNTYTFTSRIFNIAWGISKSAQPAYTVVVSGTRPVITYTINYTATGLDRESGQVAITDTLPINYLAVITPYGGGTLVGNSIVWVTDSSKIAPGQSRVLTFTAEVSRPLDNGTVLLNTALISSTHAALKVSPPVTHTVISTPTLSFKKEAIPPPGSMLSAGDMLTFTLSVTNTGGMKATNLVISDTFDAVNVRPVWYSTGGVLASRDTITWTSKIFGVDAPWVVTFTAQISNVADVTVTNLGAVMYAQREPKLGPITSAVTHVVAPAPVLLISKDDGYTKVITDQVLTYTLAYTNVGVQPATGVRITDYFSPTFVQPLSNPGWSACSGNPPICWFYNVPGGVVNSGVTGTVDFVVRVKPLAPLLRAFTNTAVITGTAATIGGSGQDMDWVFAGTDVRVESKTDEQTQVGRGDVLTYTVTYRNTGIVTITTPIILTDTLPLHTTYLGGSVPWMLTGSGEYTVAMGSLQAGKQTSVTLTLEVDADAPEGPMTNTVSAFVQDEVYMSDNSAQDVDLVSIPKITLSKSDDRSDVYPGEYLTYTIVYTNAGRIAWDVVLTETLPPQVTYIGYGWSNIGGNTYTRSLPFVDKKGGRIPLFVQVRPGAMPGLMENTVEMSARYADFPGGRVATDTTEILEMFDLDIYKTDRVGGVHPDQRITYTIYYTNAGNQVLTGVMMTDTLAGAAEYEGDTCEFGSLQPDGSRTAIIGPLDPGVVRQCQTYAVVQDDPLRSYVTNTVRIAGDQLEIDTTNNVFTDHDFLTGTEVIFADFYQVTISRITPTVGSATNFTVTVYNQGGSAEDIVGLREDEVPVASFRLAPPPPPEDDLSAQASLTCTAYSQYIYLGLYIDPYREPRFPYDPWRNYDGYIKLPIPVGSSAAVTDTWYGGTSYGPLSHSFAVPGWHHLAAQADVYFLGMDQCGWRPTFGHIPESDEMNNIGALDIWVNARDPDPDEFDGVALPIILKSASN